ncbi:putative glycosyltransferase EpsE [Pseudobythopirellula maris]|uniref:Putative glycosyltransferase EpsE n=1 Tax=Pseudobythopirellula maris TaxID=2527991 RepID=A0A5C5ZSK7_9BACT|nr:glycosyltransferase family A protein [Pseudobythopirellula maris]TWT90240.1 putative glycosyltransferase EpsE [Pseudobythopirellula maris]
MNDNPNAPRLSVLMTVFNGMPHLPAAIDSVFAQTFQDFEFVVVNDGSTDGTADYLASLDDPRVVVIERENGGTAAAANQGLKSCRGEYLARVDADDISLPTRFEKQVAFLDSHPSVGLVGTQMAALGEQGVGKSLRLPTSHQAIDQALIEGRHALGHANIMLRTALLKQLGGYWSLRMQDAWDMMLRMGEAAELANLDEVLHHYRVHSGSLNGKGMRRMRRSIDYACELAHRRRSGRPALSYVQYEAEQDSRPLVSRGLEGINLHARCQYRHALAEIHGGRPLRGYPRIAWAALCSPRLTAERLVRVFLPSGKAHPPAENSSAGNVNPA